MLERRPVAAGRFYPASGKELEREVKSFINANPPGKEGHPWAVMLPHAGYVFCGSVLGQTLAGQTLPQRLVILCPNHTGRGAMLSLWPNGEWFTPLGPVPVDEKLAKDILAGGLFAADSLAHLGEHSIEVILPFLQTQCPDLSIVPICVGTQDARILAQAGKILAMALKEPRNRDCGLVVSSDMNHYENEKITLLKDEHALKAALEADPDKLLATVRQERISMCGAGPLALALYTAKDLGQVEVELVAHESSGKASGDYEHVVGYAGLRLYL